MKNLACSFAALLVLVVPLRAQTTPLSQPLTDESETKIACEVTQPPRQSEVPVFRSQKEADSTKGVYHYKLWLPKGYSADAKKSRLPAGTR